MQWKAALTQLRICWLAMYAVASKLVNSVVSEYHYEILGSAMISSLEAEPTLQHLAWFAAVVLAPSTGMETGGKLWGTQGEGRPKVLSFFAMAIVVLLKTSFSLPWPGSLRISKMSVD